jgi:hypothetical protein
MNGLPSYARNLRRADSHSKFAIRLFLVRRTIHKQSCLYSDHFPDFGGRNGGNAMVRELIQVAKSARSPTLKSDAEKPWLAHRLLTLEPVNEDCGPPDVEASLGRDAGTVRADRPTGAVVVNRQAAARADLSDIPAMTGADSGARSVSASRLAR